MLLKQDGSARRSLRILEWCCVGDAVAAASPTGGFEDGTPFQCQLQTTGLAISILSLLGGNTDSSLHQKGICAAKLLAFSVTIGHREKVISAHP